MGIQRIESVTYRVDDLDECARFLSDFGLREIARADDRATFSTLLGQTVRIATEAALAELTHLPAPVETGPGLREMVWGVDTSEELDRLIAQVAVDRDIVTTDDGICHFVDESGWAVGLTVTAPADSAPRTVQSSNTWADVTRWNDPVRELERVRPIRMCHIALNIVKAGKEQAVAFYTDRLGFNPTEVVKPVGTFLQAEGDSDHHTFLLCHRPDRTSTNHVSFEVPGFDDVITGGNHMVAQGWQEARRLGRHTVGSNVFRFVHNPAGGRFEYAADMDRVDASYGPRVHETAPAHTLWTLRTNRDERDHHDGATA